MLADQHGPGADRLESWGSPCGGSFLGFSLGPCILAAERCGKDGARARADVANFENLLAPCQDADHQRWGQGFWRMAAHDKSANGVAGERRRDGRARSSRSAERPRRRRAKSARRSPPRPAAGWIPASAPPAPGNRLEATEGPAPGVWTPGALSLPSPPCRRPPAQARRRQARSGGLRPSGRLALSRPWVQASDWLGRVRR